MAINQIVLSGNIGKEPDFRLLPNSNSTPILTFSMAHKKVAAKGKEPETMWFDVKVWGKSAEYFKDKLGKGTPVVVSGRLEVESWEKDGQKRSRTVIVASDIEIGARKGEGAAQTTVAEDDEEYPF